MRGSSSRSGPAPEPDAIRRDRPGDQAAWVTLPTKREGPVPPWPLSDPTPREVELWARQWARPQAVMWELNGQQEEVAHHVRSLIDAERHGASVASRVLVMRQQETLGLSLPGLARNRWRIASTEPTKEATQTHGGRAASSVKDRFKVVKGGAA